MLSKVVGIISYLPDNTRIRNNRFQKLIRLVSTIKELFDLPVIIIAQSYLDKEINLLKQYNDKINIIKYNNKLGIVGARKELRKIFLSSSYDYLIMFDDDCELSGEDGSEYLRQIDANPNCFIENMRSRLELFAISKTIFSKLDYSDLEPEKGEVFEDRVFFYTLCKKFPEAHRKFHNTGLREYSLATKDPDSTWYKDQDIAKMLDLTDKIIG